MYITNLFYTQTNQFNTNPQRKIVDDKISFTSKIPKAQTQLKQIHNIENWLNTFINTANKEETIHSSLKKLHIKLTPHKSLSNGNQKITYKEHIILRQNLLKILEQHKFNAKKQRYDSSKPKSNNPTQFVNTII